MDFTLSAREDNLAALGKLAGSDEQQVIRQWLREECERAVVEHLARRGVQLRVLRGATAAELATYRRGRLTDGVTPG